MSTLRRIQRSTIFPASGTRARIAGYAGYAGAGWRDRTITGARAVAVGVMLAAAGAVAACGSSVPSGTSSAPAAADGAGTAAASSMATSIATAAESWAVVPMSADPAFWQVFARAGNSAAWKLVTPPGVAINGGIVASADGASALTVAVRPSQDLTFTPIAATANGGGAWSTGGPIDAAVAASPDAFAADGGHLAALLTSGAVETSADAGASWSTIAKPGAIAASPAGKGCGGAVRVRSISFVAPDAEVLAGGTCGTSGTAAAFTRAPGTAWQRLSLPVPGQLVRLTSGIALIQGKSGLSALWRFGWSAYAPLTGKTQPGSTPQAVATNWIKSAPLPSSGAVTASGTLQSGGAWVLLPGGRAATISPIGPTPGEPQWLLLPPVPARTSVLASGPNGAIDALAVSGDRMTVWRLAPEATVWSKVQTISVPVQSGSSG
jgi:hypothetical protein